MGRRSGSGGGRRGAHRSEPEDSGPLRTVGLMLGSTVPKRVRPPRLLSVLLISGVTVGLVLFGYSTTQIYLRFSEPPVEHGTTPAGPSAGPSTQDSEGGEARAEEDAAGAPANLSYTTVESSATAFTGRVTLTNTGSTALEGWELVLGFDGATVTSAWDVDWEATGDGVVARAPASDGGLAPGESVDVTFTAEGTAQAPSSCTFNGNPCSL
ncbi:cellulose binding domain-containing protein [Nocardiopsis sp. RSe5-2]|uniref:Cellulose binding domain-containing protein n=1 Tax=Nocardiopsis endophytica TaxID=3018445 RepID=A0ABT4U963_9ACTN|nr:cellulose binding domain-containing protein [Nocardiopsis endophytica]MDA2813495.1 cellulose binding domain-containing protein [Nocardiopsis endophytica]